MAFSYKDYVESDRVRKLADQLSRINDTKPGDWTGGQYGGQVQDLLKKIQNREKFSYDLNSDALYQQYKDKYVQQGKQAMQDTMGQAAALTGGYGSTYSQSAGQQQYNAYLQSLGDVVPELYQMALNRYQMEGDDLKAQYGLLSDQYQQEYSQYRDLLSSWQADRDYLSGRYDSERSMDYGRYTGDRDLAYQDYRAAIADDQWRQQYLESIRQFDAQQALAREQFDWQKAQAAAKASSGGGSGGRSSSGSGKKADAEKYSSSTAMRIIHDTDTGVDQSLQGQINALAAMYEAGNITKKQYNDLVYALRNPGR
nr:MAG TPA: hypothetical protein [Caudoviricetes sp.]